MSRVVVPDLCLEPGTLKLPREASHYVRHGLRLASGDRLDVLDGKGAIGRGRISSSTKRQVLVEILDVEKASPRPGRPRTRLIQSLPKGGKLAAIIRSATELGVDELRPIVTERTVPKLEGNRAVSRHERWKKIAAEACRQCGRPTVPEVFAIQGLEATVEELATGDAGGGKSLNLVLWELEGSAPLGQELVHALDQEIVTILVGPEGGLSPAEVELLRAHGYVSVSAGQYILRAETAAIAACTLLVQAVGGLDP